jgi:hypothetical protein
MEINQRIHTIMPLVRILKTIRFLFNKQTKPILLKKYLIYVSKKTCNHDR